MKVEAWIFGVCGIFFALVTPSYWVISGDWTGTSALTMATLLALMVAAYLGIQAKLHDERPEDRLDAEVADGAGEYGFFPPYSWWPLWCALPAALGVYAIAMQAWWLFVIAFGLAMVAAIGWVFEYYRGEHAH